MDQRVKKPRAATPARLTRSLTLAAYRVASGSSSESPTSVANVSGGPSGVSSEYSVIARIAESRALVAYPSVFWTAAKRVWIVVASVPSAGLLQAPGRAGRTPSQSLGQIALEVREIGVRVAVLLAGDLRVGDLVHQLDRAVGQLRPAGSVIVCTFCAGRVFYVSSSAHRRRSRALRRVLLPQRPLDPVKARPASPMLDVVDARVDLGVEGAEALGHRLDRLVVHARRPELPLGLRRCRPP